MKEVGKKTIEKSQLFIPESQRIFGGLQDVRSGEIVGPELLERTLSGDIKRALFVGEPGNGKTVNLLQFVASFTSNAQELGIDKEVVVSQYDSFLTGRNDDTQAFNRRMYRAVRERERANPDALSVVEVPAVGMAIGKNRGIEFMQLVAQDSHARNDSTAFVFLVTNGTVQTKAAFMRGEIAAMSDNTLEPHVLNEEIINYLRKHRMRLSNVPDHLGTYADLQEQFSKMARFDHMREIRKEERIAFSEWASSNPHEYRRNLDSVKTLPINESDILAVLKEFGVDYSTESAEKQAHFTAEKWVNEARDQAAYVMHRFEQLQVPEQNRYIVFNPYTHSKLELDYSVYDKQAPLPSA